MLHILRCQKCMGYTLNETCPVCNIKCLTTKPAKYSLEDRWGYWRRMYKKNVLSDKKTGKDKHQEPCNG